MRAVYFEEFGALPEVREVPDPVPSPAGVVVRVEATGLCRSDCTAGWGTTRASIYRTFPGTNLSA